MPTFTAVASSTFSGTENPLSESGVWTNAVEGSFQKRAADTKVGAKEVSTAADSFAFYSGLSFNANQYSRGNLFQDGTSGGGRGIGLLLRRGASATKTHYEFVIDHAVSSNARIARRVDPSSYTSLVAWTQTFTDGDQFTFAVETSGSTQILHVYDKTGAEITQGTGTPLVDNNTSVLTGSPGLAYSSQEGNTTLTAIQNWEGGNFSTDTLLGQAVM